MGLEMELFAQKLQIAEVDFSLDFNEIEQIYQYERDSFEKTIKTVNQYREKALLFFLYHGCLCRKIYERLNINKKIFWDTFYDLKIWNQECIDKYHVNGVEEIGWLLNHIELKLFRLGRLQFQPVCHQNSIILNVHIPKDGPLIPSECEKSYREAVEFFHGIRKFTCNSWLLNPVLKSFLSNSSNIVQFQNRYHIEQYFEEDMQGEERIFGYVAKDKTKYPEITDLQKKLKLYLLDGNKFGSAQGSFSLPIVE